MLHMWLPFGVIINKNYSNVVLMLFSLQLFLNLMMIDDDTDTGDEDELSCLFPLLMLIKHCPICPLVCDEECV